MRVLLVEDSPTVILAVKRKLKDAGIDVVHLDKFVNLSKIMASGIDAAILDLNMPALSGDQIGHYIRKYQTKKIPIIIFSSEDKAKREKIAFDLGAHIVEKGDWDGLLKVLSNI